MLNLGLMTEFPEALVYNFDAESPTHPMPYNGANHNIHLASQYTDVYNAYLYAQNEILTTIRRVGINQITLTMLADWINRIHRDIAATLARDQNLQSGRYVRRGEEVMRWHATRAIEEPLALVLAMPLNEAGGEAMIASASQELAKDFDHEASDLEAFFRLARRFQDERALLAIKENAQQKDPELDILIGNRVILNLHEAYLKDKLNDDEKKIVSKVVIVCMDSEKVPAAMDAYCQTTIDSWKSCDPKNLDQVCDFVAQAFMGLTTIHPFFNGNGRTATCLVNIMLRSFDLPAIMLRENGERENPNSSYCKAVKGLEKGDYKPMANHIKSRVQATSFPYKVEFSWPKAVALIRIEQKEYLLKIKNKFPDFDVETFHITRMTEMLVLKGSHRKRMLLRR